MGLSRRQALTPLNVLAALLAVDGHGSGLDADLLDGLHGAEYVNVDNEQGIYGKKAFAVSPLVPYPEEYSEAANKAYVDDQITAGMSGQDILDKLAEVGGPGSGLDADTVDGLHGHDLVQIAGTQTVTGAKTFSVPPTVPTPTNATDAANKNYVDSKVAGGGGTGTTDHSVLTNRDMAGQHPTAAITGLDAALAALAPLASPALTGTPTVPTASPGTSNTQLASTAFVTAAVGAAAGSGAGKKLVDTILVSQTWNVPLQLQNAAVDVYLVGGGGGGRQTNSNNAAGSTGMGGGGGGYCKLIRDVVLSNASYPLTVGAGGIGGSETMGGTITNPTDGGPTSGFSVTVDGGSAGTSSGAGGAGGSGGGSGYTSSGGGDGGWGGRDGVGAIQSGIGGGNDLYDPINPYDGKDYGGGGGGGAAAGTDTTGRRFWRGRGGGLSGGRGSGGGSGVGAAGNGVNGRGGGGGGAAPSRLSGGNGGSGVILIYA